MSEGRPTFQQTWRELDAARQWVFEDPAAAWAVAERALARAAEMPDPDATRARALALQGIVTLNRGQMREAFALASEAARAVDATDDPAAHVESSALEAQLSFFSGAYNEALRHAEAMVARADASGRAELRLFARRAGCLVMANLAVPEWPALLHEQLDLSLALANHWDEAISRNDIATHRMMDGRLDDARAELAAGFAAADRAAPRHCVALAVLHATRSELHLAHERAAEALADAERATALLDHRAEPYAYLYAMTVRCEVQALLAGGRAQDASRRGRAAVQRLGDGLPQIRSIILRDVAEALRRAGLSDQAYEALAESAELERIAFRELTELQRDLDRAVHDATAARREAEALVAANAELEALQAQLREQADRDWLTGLHNRRFLARSIDELNPASAPGPCAIAIVDLDHFKSINDRFGHEAGDHVLVRVAILLRREVRVSDVVARTGGEEFVVLMPDTRPEDARACAERLRAAIAGEPWHEVHPGLGVTASIGVASAPSAEAVDALASLADEQLYAAKDAGRNRVVATA